MTQKTRGGGERLGFRGLGFRVWGFKVPLYFGGGIGFPTKTAKGILFSRLAGTKNKSIMRL